MPPLWRFRDPLCALQEAVRGLFTTDTGQQYRTSSMKGDRGLLNSALLAVDGKLFAGNTILPVSKTLTVLNTLDGKSANNDTATPCVLFPA